jgi:hypothetical protein
MEGDVMSDIWKDIEGYNGDYQVSNIGFVRSRIRPSGGGTIRKEDWHILEESLTYGRHPTVTLKNTYKEKYSEGNKRHSVARLVLCAFVGEPPSEKHQAIHIDGKCHNVELNNLKWGTRKELSTLIKKNDAMPVGVLLPQHKLSREDVIEIKDELINGFLTISEISNIFAVSRTTIYRIKENKAWKHIPWPDGKINKHTYKQCKLCGDQFKTDRFFCGGQPEKYCSERCRKNQEVLYSLGKTYEEHYGIYKGVCKCCGKEYKVDQSTRIKSDKNFYFSKKFCSKKCSKRNVYLERVGKCYNDVYGTIEKDCDFCGQVFELGPDDNKAQKYCRSKDCDKERDRLRSAKKRWNGKGYWDREGKNDKLQRNYTY